MKIIKISTSKWKAANCEVDLLGARVILKPQHFVEPAQRSDPPPDGAVRRVRLQPLYVQAQRLRANWKRLAISFTAPIDKCARVGVV